MQKLIFLRNSHEISGWFGRNYKKNFNVHLPFFQSQHGASNVELSVNEKYLRKTEEIEKTEKDLKHWANMREPHFIPGFLKNKTMLSHPSVRNVYVT